MNVFCIVFACNERCSLMDYFVTVYIGPIIITVIRYVKRMLYSSKNKQRFKKELCCVLQRKEFHWNTGRKRLRGAVTLASGNISQTTIYGENRLLFANLV